MTEVLTKTEATIPELETAVRESEQHERALAREVDELPAKIEQAAHQHARRMADAARQGKDALKDTDQESAVPALHRKEKELPYLRWLQAIKTAALQVELAELRIGERKQAREAAKAELPEARDAFHAAEKRYNLLRGRMNRAEYGYDARRSERAAAQKRLQALEQ